MIRVISMSDGSFAGSRYSENLLMGITSKIYKLGRNGSNLGLTWA